ncbi:MAG TPA: hypothetical protein VLJ16_05500 [Acidobacteriota bacterium]|nr:hypothetical protein [Acidobacteriota bacterium]
MKKLLALTVGFLLVGLAFGLAQEKAQEQAQAKTALKAQGQIQQNKVQAKSEFRRRNRVAFVDENGDGINDLARDADGDGIPNGQDPDWTHPGDGAGYKARNGKGTVATATGAEAKGGHAYRLQRDADGDGIPNGQDPDWVKPGDGTGYKAAHKIGKGSFRTGLTAAGRASGTGVCDGTGPKGGAQRKGRR